MPAPTIQYLRLDAAYDPIFDPTVALTDINAVAQIMLTQLNLFLGEWFENLNLGLPVLQTMLGQLGSQRALAAMQLSVQQYLQTTVPYLVSVGPITASLSSAGALAIVVQAQTVSGNGR